MSAHSNRIEKVINEARRNMETVTRDKISKIARSGDVSAMLEFEILMTKIENDLQLFNAMNNVGNIGKNELLRAETLLENSKKMKKLLLVGSK